MKDTITVTATSESGGTEVTLSDGTVLTIKASIIEAWRIANEYDANGFPIYQVRASLASTTKQVGDGLKKS
jgi:hypothetical protein